MRDGVADAGVADLLDRGGQHADLAWAKLGNVDHCGLQHGQLVDAVDGVRLHHADAVALPDDSVHDPDHDHDAQIGIIPAVDQHGLERRVAVAHGGRQARDDGFQHVGNAKPGLGRNLQRVRGVDADDLLDVLLDPLGLGGGQVDLVQDRHDLVARVDGLIDVGQRLRLDALAGIDDQQAALDRAHGPADLVGEVDVAGGVDQVQHIGPPVARRIFDAHGVGLDGDAALALDIHAVQQLGLHVAFGHRARHLDQTVGQRGFAVVDMGHDREVADKIKVGHGRAILGLWRCGKRVQRGDMPAARNWVRRRRASRSMA